MRVALRLMPCSLTTTFQIKMTFVLRQRLSWTHSGQRPLHEFKIEQTPRRESFSPTLSLGIFLAVRVTRQDVEQRVINELKPIGAADIEKTEGKWRDGTWVDFNPVAVPKLVVNQDRSPAP